MQVELSGRKALVCGASKGIGRAIAERLAASGCIVVSLARNETKLQQLTGELPGAGHSYIAADQSEVDTLIGKIRSHQSNAQPFDILVNNSGGPAGGPITEATTEQFLAAFQQHLIVNSELTRCLLPAMKDKKFGRILNIVSTSVKIPLAGLGVSNTVRGAVANWAKTLASEVASSGITVNSVLPGATSTERLDQIIRNKSSKQGVSEAEASALMRKQIPAGRFGEAEEIANLVCFLASPLASYITGTAIPVDGGRTGSL